MVERRQDTASRGARARIGLAAAAAGALLLVLAAPATGSMNKTRVLERNGQTIYVSRDVGKQAFPVDWVEHDPRRHGEDGLVLYYRIDRTELPPGISWDDTEAAIDSAVATFNAQACGRNLQLVRLPSDPDDDLGHMQHRVGLGGSPTPQADLTFAGWVPDEFFTAAGYPGALGLTVPAAWDATTGDQVWGGLDVLDPDADLADHDGDGDRDLFAMEMYFTSNFDYVVDDDDLANTLFVIDVESIVLHELGHALGMDHFGRYDVVFDEDGNFVDVVVNPNSVTVMNTANYYVKRDLAGADRASFCGIYGDWGR